MFRDTGSRRLRIAKTTINSTAMPIVSNVPVNKAANGKIDKPSPPSIDKQEQRNRWEKWNEKTQRTKNEYINRFIHTKQMCGVNEHNSNRMSIHTCARSNHDLSYKLENFPIDGNDYLLSFEK